MGMLLPDQFHYTLVNKEHYEPLERYTPNEEDFIALAKRRLPKDWRHFRNGIWFYCSPPRATLPSQGWKIHVSATRANAAAVLDTVCRSLGENGVGFKFALDRYIFFLLQTKRWSRGGAGKFITVYPEETGQCGKLLEDLSQALVGYRGPYILSDRRYGDSKTVHYRYGGSLPSKRLTFRGEFVPIITSASATIDDERTPYFNPPEGVLDPFATDSPQRDQGDDHRLKHGRYTIDDAISFSNAGGVYLARDQDGRKVIIKEARPFTAQSPQAFDAIELLRKEYRLLCALRGTGVAPEPIDFFEDWEHSFLVEEYVEGALLRGFTAGLSLALSTRPTEDNAREFLRRFCDLYARIGDALHLLHDHGIVFSDVSHYNIIVSEDGSRVWFIDFEGAYEKGVDVPTLLYTPGFAPQQMISEGTSRPEDDCYAFGGLMLAGILPINDLMALNPLAFEPFLASWVRDLGIPQPIADCIRGLMMPERAERMPLTKAIQVLRSSLVAGKPDVGTSEVDQEDLERLLDQMVAYLLSAADFDRDDRLFPAAPAVFQTNPLNISYGACGVAHVLKYIKGTIDPRIIDWILRHKISPDDYPPGLYTGLSGIAWSLLELGVRDRAEQVARMTHEHPVLWDSPDLFHGVAGWGLGQLRFFLATDEELYLAKAVEAGDFLLANRSQTETGSSWFVDRAEFCGLGHGSAGISLFLLNLYQVTGNEDLLRAGESGLDFVLAKALNTPDGGATWRIQEGHPTFTPYWRWGSAGIGMTMLRYLRETGDERYSKMLSRIIVDSDRKYSIFPGQHLGLAGIGEFMLDVSQLGTEPSSREVGLSGAKKVLSGMLAFKLARDKGVAFPGEDRTRISCDLGTGSAGIAAFVHRFLHGGSWAFSLDAHAGKKHPRYGGVESGVASLMSSNGGAS